MGLCFINQGRLLFMQALKKEGKFRHKKGVQENKKGVQENKKGVQSKRKG